MKYATNQKSVLMDFLRHNSASAKSAEEIYRGIGEAAGKSTVYRLLSELAENGIINRFARENGKGVLYQLPEKEACCGHLHMKCLECDRIIHMDDERSEKLLKQISASSDFDVSEGKTVLFGVCSACKKSK